MSWFHVPTQATLTTLVGRKRLQFIQNLEWSDLFKHVIEASTTEALDHSWDSGIHQNVFMGENSHAGCVPQDIC